LKSQSDTAVHNALKPQFYFIDKQRTSADMRVGDGSIGVVVEERFALLAVVTHRIVLAVIANSSAHSTGCLVDGGVEVTTRRVAVALAP